MSLPNTSHEHLVHFNCPVCQKWWSIGDAPERSFWFCPWCGTLLSENDEEKNLATEIHLLLDQVASKIKQMPPYIETDILEKIRQKDLNNNK